eukprot:CAMPEP_0119408450 /NCGR_PEP_ID=MMETSP1335-20130426/1997_1 /TAXON_ID=259385 /ORGANISM="Chrysoculter rhomboideus, Strain RCC1486" /LENGTH=48 /DNA_ID= /DNA_START= /DNA_END= /DNA_ORIENTATION=
MPWCGRHTSLLSLLSRGVARLRPEGLLSVSVPSRTWFGSNTPERKVEV